MADTEELNLAMEIARREARIRYWRKNFNEANLSTDDLRSAGELFDTLVLMLAKLGGEKSAEEQKASFQRVFAIERQLSELFSKARQVTAKTSDPEKREDFLIAD